MSEKVQMNFTELKFDEGRAPFLVKLFDGPENELHVFIAGAVQGQNSSTELARVTDENLRAIIAASTAIEPDVNHIYEIVFPSYIIYQTRNESYCSSDKEEIGSGEFLIIFQKSRFIDHLPALTDVCLLDDGSYYPGKWIHYGICTQNHIIDVVSHCKPEVFRIV